ncbi:GNAT family N-acetyltransferase [Novosphingobium sp. NPDC080210]|uniref:GNAT family N-acetyltransferase n=1 Tax=Novosphingobium sp. NPDC080210 TaxID=3390596 RepID=UPI003D08A588
MNNPPDDIDRIMAVMQAAFAPEYGEAWNRRQVEDALLMGNCFYCLLTEAGAAPQGAEPAAAFFLSRYGFEEEELLLLAVDPEHRRKGLAAKLISYLETSAQKRGAKRLLLEMRRGNPAELLYRAHGFVPIGQRVNYYRTPSGERLDALTFCKEIG